MNKRQKKKRIRIYNKKLCEHYPFLIPRNRHEKGIPKHWYYDYTMFDFFPRGWKHAFGNMLLEELREALIHTDTFSEFRILSCKEKYGHLSLFGWNVKEEVQKVIDKYEYISGYICIQCGQPDVGLVNNYGWFIPLCENCWNRINQQRIENGMVSRAFKEVSQGNITPIPDEYVVALYTNHGKIKETIDISQTVQKIRAKYRLSEVIV